MVVAHFYSVQILYKEMLDIDQRYLPWLKLNDHMRGAAPQVTIDGESSLY